MVAAIYLSNTMHVLTIKTKSLMTYATSGVISDPRSILTILSGKKPLNSTRSCYLADDNRIKLPLLYPWSK